MTDSLLTSPGNAAQTLQPGPAPERKLAAYDELDARLRLGNEHDAARLAARYNPLVAAASRLLSALGRLKPHTEAVQLAALRARLGKRINQFTRQSLQAGIDPKNVKIASYVLCTAADEAVLTSDWGQKSDWAAASLLNTFHGETSGGEKFFQLLERFMRLPAGNVDIMELMYLCLMLGYEGRYAAIPHGGKQLQRLRLDLYESIQRQRGETCSRVSLIPAARRHEQRPTVMVIPGWLPVLLTLSSLGLLYSGFAWVLDKQREKALTAFQSFDSALVAPASTRDLAR